MAKPNKEGKKSRRRWMSVISGLVVVTFFVVALMPKRLPVDIITAERGDFLVTVNEDGKTRVKDRYVIDAPLDGHLGRIDLRPGDPVEAAMVVARIVPLSPPLLDARTKAEA
ncbi:MAG: hypothetical protein WCE62_17105, partial [Polyangiales bacterium]